MASQSTDDTRRNLELDRRITGEEMETLWVNMLRAPSLVRNAAGIVTSEHWYEAGHPEYAVLWTALQQLLKDAPNAELKMPTIRQRFLMLVKDVDEHLPQHVIDDIADDPRLVGDPKAIGLLYHAFRKVEPADLDFDYATRQLTRFANEYAVVQPLKKLLNDEQFRESAPRDITQFLASINSSAERVRGLNLAAYDEVLFPPGWNDAPLIGAPTYLPFLDAFLSGGMIDGEVFGLLGPFGGGKTTLALALLVASARAFRAEGLRENKPPLHAYYFGYEDGLKTYRARVMSCASHVDRTTVERSGPYSVTGGQLKDYEIEYWAMQNPDPNHPLDRSQMLGEADRMARADREISETCHLVDMGAPGRGNGGMDEIAAILEREKQMFGREPGIVIIDYAGVMARRFVAATKRNSGTSEEYAAINAMPDKAKQMGVRFHTPVWLLHQYKGAANKKSPTADMSHVDASGASSFGENCDFCICVGQKDKETRVARVQCTKARRGGTDGMETLMYLDGAYANVTDAGSTYRLEEGTGQIVPVSMYNAMHGGDEDAAAAPPAERVQAAGQPRRRRANETLDDAMPWRGI